MEQRNFVLFFVALNFISLIVYSQKTRPFYVELGIGLQQHFNPNSDSEHLIGGYDSLSFHKGNKQHYAVGFKVSRPIDFVMGYYNTIHAFKTQLQLSYYKQDMGLFQPYNFNKEEPHQLMYADLMITKGTFFYDVFSNHHGESKRICWWGGFSAGMIMPLYISLNKKTANDFGIDRFHRNTQFFLGIDNRMTIQIVKCRIYIVPAMSILFPLSGSIGRLEMQPDSEFVATRPVSVHTINYSLAFGYRLSIR